MTDSERLLAMHEEVRSLRERLDQNAQALAELAEAMSCVRFSVEDLAIRWGVSVSTLEHSPWKLPNYGRADIVGRGGRRYWLLSSVRAIEKRPEGDRLREWDSMSASERRRAMGRTA